MPGAIQSAEYMQLERLVRIYPRSCSAHIWRLAQINPARDYGEFHKRRRARTVAAPRARTLRPHLGCPTSYRVDERSRFRRRPAQRRPRWISAPRCVIGAMTPTLRRWSRHRSTVPTLPMRWGPPVLGARASLRLSGALDFGWWTGAFAAGRQVPTAWTDHARGVQLNLANARDVEYMSGRNRTLNQEFSRLPVRMVCLIQKNRPRAGNWPMHM
ncbi:hypothetical protein ATK86_5555 [Nocardia fluminea]|uniref:Uncharacterized protein n=1 Tax=Nocardia fluminea TaxID=134984 RepID=A0A2N3VHK0_9NOCA|nr:hypothetical protein ATK86_5555 [Nocardia fluminea]